MICFAVMMIGQTANRNAFPPIHSYNSNGFLICSQYGYGDKSAQSVAFAIAEAGAMCKVRKALLLQNTSAATTQSAVPSISTLAHTDCRVHCACLSCVYVFRDLEQTCRQALRQ